MSGFYSRMGWYDREGNLMVGCFFVSMAAIGVVFGLVLWLVLR